VPAKTADAIITENADARIDGLRSSLSLLALIALFTTSRFPARQPSAAPTEPPLTTRPGPPARHRYTRWNTPSPPCLALPAGTVRRRDQR
jgi:hypothetical protein